MISWTESIEASAPVEVAWRAVLDQHQLMSWSAWPEATGFTCAVEGDGVSEGSCIVFTAPDGSEAGRQRIVEVDRERLTVRNRLRNRGPGGRVVEPEVDLRVDDLGGRVRVHLDFRVEPPVPRLLLPVARLFLARKIRPLHRKDLEQLRDQLEARTTEGEAASG